MNVIVDVSRMNVNMRVSEDLIEGKENLISAESAIHFRRHSFIVRAMPQSLSKVILRIIFSTKNRESWLESHMQPRVHAYLATICRDPGAELVHVVRCC
jgi:hypothetical protein